MTKLYPFSAIVGQEMVKKALLVLLINPRVKGLLVSGGKGSGKSTICRSINTLGLDINFKNLPLNVTEDRVFGGVNFEKTIYTGKNHLQKGLISQVDGGFLYLDEINLLDKEIGDGLLDSMETGSINIQREGISHRSISNFSMIGTMNPEEGQLSPQFLDRFAMSVDMEEEKDADNRIEVIRRVLDFEDDPEGFINRFNDDTKKIYKQIIKSRELLEKITISYDIYDFISRLASKSNVEGHRGEIYLTEVSKTIATLNNRDYINLSDITEASKLVLPHRKKDESLEEDIDANNQVNEGDKKDNPETDLSNMAGNHRESDISNNDLNELDEKNSETEEKYDEDMENQELHLRADKIFELKNLAWSKLDMEKRFAEGKRNKTQSKDKRGRYIRNRVPNEDYSDIALDASLRKAAPFQKYRDKEGLAISIKKSDILIKEREVRTGSHVIFLVDASGSMGANERMIEVKNTILSLLMASYEKRDKISLITFHHDQAQLLLPFTGSIELAKNKLQDLPTGGRTPLAEGLYKSLNMFKSEKIKNPSIIPLLVLITDGRANYSNFSKDNPLDDALKIAKLIEKENINSVVIDTENNFISFQLAKKLASIMDANYYEMDDLKADHLEKIVLDNKNVELKSRIQIT